MKLCNFKGALHVLSVAMLMSAWTSCTGDLTEERPQAESQSVLVGLRLDDEQTKTTAADDGLSTVWTENDEVALWARNSSDDNILEAQRFSLSSTYGEKGWFTSVLASEMTYDQYVYYASYPYPESVSGTEARFTVPYVQDGRASDGADIMISSAVQSGPLRNFTGVEGLSVSMDHLLHILRFYIPNGIDAFDGEPVEKIVFTMPDDVAGTLTVDVTSPFDGELTQGRDEITLDLAEPLYASGPKSRSYAFATIFPVDCADGDVLQARLITRSKSANAVPVALNGRSFRAGHATAVPLVPETAEELYRINFKIDSNNLGENVQSITFTAPADCNWGNGSNVYTYEPAYELKAGDSFSVEFSDEVAFRGMNLADIEVTYESEHVICSETVSLESLMSTSSTDVALNVPYLLFEDFSDVPSFNSDDEHKTTNAGTKDAHQFLNGWTAARAGASEGLCIRIACRRETSADYPARADSKPMFTIKSPVDVELTFDYGADYQVGGIAVLTGNVGQNISVGYVTSTTAYKSDSKTGTFESENSFYIKEQTGSYVDLPHIAEMTIHGIPAGETNRISWRADIEHQAGLTNTTSWFYIDNIKVRVAPGQ